MKKLAIIGASYLQLPLILKAKEMNMETHVFAWSAGDVGEKAADFFYPISIIEKEMILKKCQEIKIDGICSIASDLAMITVNYVASSMHLTGNSVSCTWKSTNKHLMKLAFEQHHIPSSRSILVGMESKLDDLQMDMPLIVKPTDRSGSRGICKISSMSELKAAIAGACKQSFEKKALIEEYIEGQEYSVECISWNGEHNFLATTKKFTTGAPNFIETAHMEPADLSESEIEKIKKIVFRALDALEIKYGASHSEIKINSGGEIKVIEIGGRMGGDCIGSDLVFLSTGIDFVKAVIQISLGKKPKLDRGACPQCAAVRYVLNSRDLLALQEMESRHPEMVVRKEVMQLSDRDVTDSSTRFGMYVLKSDTVEAFKEYLPEDIL